MHLVDRFPATCSLRHKSEMVVYEAAHAIVNLKRTTSRELIPAVSVLQLFCSSPKPTLRFAAVRTLNQVCDPALESKPFDVIKRPYFPPNS